MSHKLGILLSGRGSNFVAIAESCRAGRIDAGIAIVISNRADAAGIASAEKMGLRTRVIPSKGRVRGEHDSEVVVELKKHEVEIVCLAGYMRLLSPEFVRAFPDRILNIHPSLLPAFKGLNVHEQALAAGVRVSGCTVHYVIPELDSGPAIVQAPVPVEHGDTPETLAARVLEAEHRIYPLALKRVADGAA